MEDNLDYIKAAKEAFQNFEVKVVETYKEAEETLKKIEPDIAFVDMYFPKDKGLKQECMGIEFGYELLKKNIPFLIISALSDGHSNISGPDVPYGHPDKVDWLDEIFSPKDNPKTWKDAMDYLMKEVLKTTLEKFLKK